MNLQRIDPEWAWSPFEPKAGQWTRSTAAHLYRRAGFGAASKQLDQAVEAGAAASVDAICSARETDADVAQYEALCDSVIAGGDPQGLAAAWAYRILTTPAQLQEKLTLFWHGHFATSAAKVEDAALMHRQNELFRRHAQGDFAALVQAVSKDPAMLIYLDSVTNRKAHPNENYAREVMELFCLGEGNYSENDVLQLARCFTGWEIKRGKYRFNRYQHDFGEKSIFGKQGEFGGEEGVKLVLEHPKGPEFVVGKLVRYFVMDEPDASPELLAPLARQLRGDAWQIGPVVRRILGSNLFFSPSVRAAKVRSPVEYVTGVLRCLQGSTNANLLSRGCLDVGQGLFYPPNVKGWDGGRAWINSSTLLGRANLMKRILDHEKTRFGGGGLDELLEENGIEETSDMVQWFVDLLVAPQLNKDVVAQLVEAASKATGNDDKRARKALYMICALPECQLA